MDPNSHQREIKLDCLLWENQAYTQHKNKAQRTNKMKMMSIVAVTPKEDAIDEIAELITESRKDGVAGLDVYSIVHTRDDELVIVNQWASLDAFMDYVNGPHNMIELIEHLCLRYDEENVCRAYSGAILAQHSQA